MKLIIEIPEEYKVLFNTERCESKFDSLATNEFGYVLRKAFENATPLTEPIYNIVIDEDKMMFLRNAITDERLVIEKRLTESDDCINRQATYQKMLELQGKKRDRYLDIDDVRVVLQGMSSVQPNREKGEWYIYQDYWYECSKCGCLRYMPTFTENYCPNCGADMKG
jgi:hypothetical protein